MNGLESEARPGKINATIGAGPFLMAILRNGGVEIPRTEDDYPVIPVIASRDNNGIPWSEPFVNPKNGENQADKERRSGIESFVTEEIPGDIKRSWIRKLFRRI